MNFYGLDKSAILFQVLGESLALTHVSKIAETDIIKNKSQIP